MGLAIIHTAADLAGDFDNLPHLKRKMKAEAIRQIGISHVVKLAHKHRKIHHRHIAADPQQTGNRHHPPAPGCGDAPCRDIRDRFDRTGGSNTFNPWQPKAWPYDTAMPEGLPPIGEGPVTVYQAAQQRLAEPVKLQPIEHVVGSVLDVSA